MLEVGPVFPLQTESRGMSALGESSGQRQCRRRTHSEAENSVQSVLVCAKSEQVRHMGEN